MIITDKAQIKIAELRESNNLRLSGSDELECYELIESDLKLPADATFVRSSVAYLSDGTQIYANIPRFEPGKFGKALLLEENTTNLLTANQSSVETDLTGFTRFGDSTLTRDTTIAWHGVASIKTIASTSNAGWYIQVPGGNVPRNTAYAASLYVKGAGQINVDLYHNADADTLQSITVNLKTDWQRVIVTGTTRDEDYPLRLYVRSSGGAAEWYADGIQIEQKPYPTSFTDGTRAAETLTIPTEGVLNPQEGTVECRAYVNSASKYPNRYSTIFIADAGGVGKGIWLYHENGDNYWRYQIKDENTNVKIIRVPDSEITDGWHYFAITWNVLEAKLFVDGVLRGTITNPPLPSTIIRINVGHLNGTNQFNTLIDDLRISNRARSDEEILAAYQSGQPLLVDEWTTYKLDFDDKVRITTQGQIICNELIEI